jgi:hypothetical protein
MKGPTDFAQQSRTTLKVSVLGIASSAILCAVPGNTRAASRHARVASMLKLESRGVLGSMRLRISNALVVVAIGELHRSIFFAPFARIDPVNSSFSDGDAFSWAWAWLHTISWASLNMFWDQIMFFRLPRLQHCSLKDNHYKKEKIQPDLEHSLSRIVQHSRLGPEQRDWTTRVSSWYSHQQNSIEKSSFQSYISITA